MVSHLAGDVGSAHSSRGRRNWGRGSRKMGARVRETTESYVPHGEWSVAAKNGIITRRGWSRFLLGLLPLWVSCETASVAAARATEPPRDLKNGRARSRKGGGRRGRSAEGMLSGATLARAATRQCGKCSSARGSDSSSNFSSHPHHVRRRSPTTRVHTRVPRCPKRQRRGRKGEGEATSQEGGEGI